MLNAPESPLDKKHKVKMAFGNGMRPDVWGKFQERFNIPTVFEYYTMSEGNEKDSICLVCVCGRNEESEAIEM